MILSVTGFQELPKYVYNMVGYAITCFNTTAERWIRLIQKKMIGPNVRLFLKIRVQKLKWKF